MATFFLFGDSITYGFSDPEGGWASRLRRHLDSGALGASGGEGATIYNLGIPGDTTTGVLSRFDSESVVRLDESESPKDRLVIFAFGANDSSEIDSEAMVPPEEFETNVLSLILKAHAIAGSVLFLGATPVDETRTHPVPWHAGLCYHNVGIRKYNEILKRICRKNGVWFLDPSYRFGRKYKSLLQDGLHPNSDGHEMMCDAIKEFLVAKKLIH